jgi:hypothetical protein
MKKIEQEERRVRGKKLMRRSNLPSMESICLRLASISSLKKSLSSTKKVVEIVRFMRADIHQFNEAGSRKCFAHASGILNPSISLNRCVAFAGAEILI